MKYFLIFILLLSFNTKSRSQFVNFDWAKSLDLATGFSGDVTYLIGVDSLKNVYLAGNFRNTMDLDPGPGIFNVTCPLDNMFICKLDSSGNFIWGKQIGGNRFTICKSLFVDSTGNVYTTGRFTGTTDFDPGSGVFNLSANPTAIPECNAIFISKLDSSGIFQWAKKIGGEGSAYTGFAINVDIKGNVYTTGYFVGVTDLDPGPGVLNLGSDGIVNTFVLKLDNGGNFKFAKVFNGNNSANGEDINTDKVGNIYISGYYSGTVDFDPGPGVFNLVTSISTFNPFISKLDSLGNFIWAKPDIGRCPLVIDAFQNIFTFTGVNGQIGNITKYDINGNIVWTKSIGCSPITHLQVSPIVLDEFGNIYITGIFRFTQDFDPGPDVFNMTASGGRFEADAFIARYDLNGNFVWAKSFGNFAEELPLSIEVDKSGSVYTAGTYVFTVDFDPGSGIYNINPGIQGGANYIHKMKRCNNVTTSTINIYTCNTYTLNGIIYTSSGTYFQSLLNTNGCDSILTLNLLLGGSNDTSNVITCDSHTWNGQAYTISGFYRDTLISSSGCDSIINLNLNIKNSITSTINAIICDRQAYYGHTTAGTYTDTYVAANGCDSIRTLNLTVKQKSTSTIAITLCQGQSYSGHTTSGAYVDTYVAANGCDSIRRLNLIVNPKKFTALNKIICEGQTYFAGGTMQTSSGIYKDTLQTFLGCDSIITVNLTVNPKPRPDLGQDRNLCTGTFLTLNPGSFNSYQWQNMSAASVFTANTTGMYWVTVTDSKSCSNTDSIRINAIVPLPTNFLKQTDSICSYENIVLAPLNNYKTYQWSTGSIQKNITVQAPGQYWLKVIDTNDCVGIDTISVLPKQCITAIFIPNAFTPNGDSKNDILRAIVYGKTVSFKFQVYDRSGQLIFQTMNPDQGWNGYYGGTPSSTAVYVWQCFYQLEGSQPAYQKGSVTLIR